MTRGNSDDVERRRHNAQDKADENEKKHFEQPEITDPYHSGIGPYGDPRPGSMSS